MHEGEGGGRGHKIWSEQRHRQKVRARDRCPERSYCPPHPANTAMHQQVEQADKRTEQKRTEQAKRKQLRKARWCSALLLIAYIVQVSSATWPERPLDFLPATHRLQGRTEPGPSCHWPATHLRGG